MKFRTGRYGEYFQLFQGVKRFVFTSGLDRRSRHQRRQASMRTPYTDCTSVHPVLLENSSKPKQGQCGVEP